MKIYRGRRHEGPPERLTIDVYDDRTERVYPLVLASAPHTDGLEWGFAGSGPHNTARAILADYMGDVTPELASAFENAVIARLGREGFELSGARIEDWLQTNSSRSREA